MDDLLVVSGVEVGGSAVASYVGGHTTWCEPRGLLVLDTIRLRTAESISWGNARGGA